MGNTVPEGYNYDGGLASSYAPRRRTMLEEVTYQPIEGLDTANYTPPVQNPPSAGNGGETTKQVESPTGMGRTMANTLAGAQIGLGILGYLENRKTGKLQRSALRQDIAAAKEHQANRAALRESWAKAWNSEGS